GSDVCSSDLGHLGAPVRHIDAHIARGEEEQGVPEPVHAAVQRVCGAHDKVHQPPGDVLGQRLHRHDHGPPLLEAVNHGLNILKPGRLLHHDAETLLVTACPGQADQAGPAGIGFRAGLGRRKLRLLSRGLFRLDPKKTENPVEEAAAAAVVVHARLGPKRDVPIRTIVEPSSTATSKSLLIPIESHSMLTPGMPASATASARRRSSRKAGWAAAGSSTGGAMVIRRLTASPGSPATVRTTSSTSPGARPCFVPSPATLTCTSTGTTLPRAWARREMASAKGSRSSEWITSKSSRHCLTLLVCRCPIMCRRTPAGNMGNLARASCTRFSPMSVTPAATACWTVAMSTFFVTAI